MIGTGYKQVSPTKVRITLRQGVKFHDGSDFNAEDVVFSLTRAMEKTSNYGVYTQGIDKVVKVDDHTVDIFTKGPNPVLQRQLTVENVALRRVDDSLDVRRQQDLAVDDTAGETRRQLVDRIKDVLHESRARVFPVSALEGIRRMAAEQIHDMLSGWRQCVIDGRWNDSGDEWPA